MPPPYTSPPPPRRTHTALFAALLAFAAGGALAGWLVWHGDLDTVLPKRQTYAGPAQDAEPLAVPPAPAPAVPLAASAEVPVGLGGVETRLALLEERFSRIDHQANAAAANASRAEGLLIALATRRMIDRGEPLGYLEEQLRLRFGGAQPQAVQTIVAASRHPITLFLLSSQLAAAAPALSGARHEESSWQKLRREFASLFVIRRSSPNAARPLDRAERAQVLLKAGRIEDAIAEVERLPGAEEAQDWIASARRYDAAQRALDIVETTAMLETRGLRGGDGSVVDQPSPLARPTPEAPAPSQPEAEPEPAPQPQPAPEPQPTGSN